MKKDEYQHQAAPVLIVDDRYENLLAMEKILKPLELDIVKADSGNMAVALALEQSFAVILLDVQMPEMDGFEAAALLRENEKSKNTPIIFVTAISKELSHIFEGYEAGAVDYLFKPVDPYILQNKVKVFVELFREKNSQLKSLVKKLQNTQKELEQSNQELTKLARNDPMTQLPNRLQLEEAANRLIASSSRFDRQFALLFLDLDNFKTINDTLGHDVGDLVLKETAKRLLSCIRTDDFVARLGGDEFAILLSDTKSYHLAGKVADKVLKAVGCSYQVGGHELHVSASIGIACYPDAGIDLKSLTKHADIALYQAKDKGRNCSHYFTERLNKKHKRRTEIENALHFAIEKKQLHLLYQPVFDIKLNQVVGMEALLRWEHPTLGLVSPAEFIPISEEIGLANQLGEWVLHTACHQFSTWYQAGYKHLSFALNLSVCQLLQTGLLDHISKLHKTLNLPASQLVFEITETALMQEEKKSMHLLKSLDSLGFQISIDDFGTGYSSLSRLQEMPIKILKIDRAFISKVGKADHEVIVNAIIDLAKNLKLSVVAEGVETKEQEDFLIKHNCLVAQGFLYSKPLSVDDMTALL
jgi:diguanylate cyclase (GGDEF)-like protein